jgi:ATP-dependent exoDNAse (exonuclease V) beta subunit
MPVIVRLEDGRMVEGITDLAFLEGGNWHVVDFKTDTELQLGHYQRQLAWYVYALARITGRETRGWLLSI